MGYELRLYVGELILVAPKTPLILNSFGMVDLCKVGNAEIGKLDNLRKEKPLTPIPAYIFAEDGNTRIAEDHYGGPLRVCTFTETLAALKIDIKFSVYRRFAWALTLLKGIEKTEFVPALTSKSQRDRAYSKRHFQDLKEFEEVGTILSDTPREFFWDKENCSWDVRGIGVLLYGH